MVGAVAPVAQNRMTRPFVNFRRSSPRKAAGSGGWLAFYRRRLSLNLAAAVSPAGTLPAKTAKAKERR